MNMDDSRVPTISGNLHMRTGMFAHMANFRHHGITQIDLLNVKLLGDMMPKRALILTHLAISKCPGAHVIRIHPRILRDSKKGLPSTMAICLIVTHMYVPIKRCYTCSNDSQCSNDSGPLRALKAKCLATRSRWTRHRAECQWFLTQRNGFSDGWW